MSGNDVISLSRRAFLQSAAAGPALFASPAAAASREPVTYAPQGPHEVAVRAAHDGTWRKVQSILSPSAEDLLVHPGFPVLYVINGLQEDNGLPRSTVEAWRIDAATGLLRERISRLPLSLSATGARRAALSPDMRHLVVCAFNGGIIDVLSLGPQGELEQIASRTKLVGASVHPELQASAHPHTAAFHPDGQWLAVSDLGSDAIRVFRWEGDGTLRPTDRYGLQPGSGPSGLAFDEAGRALSVLNEIAGRISIHGFDRRTGQIEEEGSSFGSGWTGAGTGRLCWQDQELSLFAGIHRLSRFHTGNHGEPSSSQDPNAAATTVLAWQKVNWSPRLLGIGMSRVS